MTGVNLIIMSYDRQTAVRVHDKLKLRAAGQVRPEYPENDVLFSYMLK